MALGVATGLLILLGFYLYGSGEEAEPIEAPEATVPEREVRE